MGFIENWKTKRQQKKLDYYNAYYHEVAYDKLCKRMYEEDKKTICKVTVTVGEQLDPYTTREIGFFDNVMFTGTDKEGNQYRFTEDKKKSDIHTGETVTLYARLVQRTSDKTIPILFVFYYLKEENN